MAAGNAYVVYPLDTVHHEMDGVICSHSVYKSVWSPVISRSTLVLEKEPASKFIWWIYSGSDKGFSDSGPDSVGIFIHTSCGNLLHDGYVVHYSASVILLWEGGKQTLRSSM